ncbi:MAG: PDZ domain-containing protein, partial [Chlamydiia bacterium]|nr:PDZ domain-containing protein [Chlamydiia bacterium]
TGAVNTYSRCRPEDLKSFFEYSKPKQAFDQGFPMPLFALLLALFCVSYGYAEDTTLPTRREYLFDHQALLNVGYPILNAAADLTPRWRYGYGFELHDQPYYNTRASEDKLAGKTRDAWLMPWPTISLMGSFSHAATTGLQVNDRILSINGENVEKESAEQLMERLDRMGRLHHRSIHVAVSRHANVIVQTIRGVRLADLDLRILNTSAVDAYAEDGKLVITTGMLRYAQQEEDLAVVLAYITAQGVYQIAAENETRFEELGLADPKHQQTLVDELSIYLLAKNKLAYDRLPEFWNTLAAKQSVVDVGDFLINNPVTRERIHRIKTHITAMDAQLRKDSPMLPPVIAEALGKKKQRFKRRAA